MQTTRTQTRTPMLLSRSPVPGAFLRTACALVVLMAGGFNAPAHADAAALEATANGHVFEGPMAVMDGDGLWAAGRELRLHGIDAFETSQPCHMAGSGTPYACGVEARDKLVRLMRRHGNQARCVQVDMDGYDRPVVACTAGKTDLGEAMIASGWAMAYERYLEGEKLQRYAAAQKRAQAARVGAWAGTFTQPWNWRRRR